ncbi:MAG: hypothetical protein V2I74_13220 [Erythrobacter sp.]|jgi:hypothetical protein|nr:hypothetical protein [Erythrobacter sp.]
MIVLEVLALLVAASSSTQVGEWKVQCTDNLEIGDGAYDECRMVKKTGGLEVEILRTAKGTATSVKQKGCKPPNVVPPTEKSQEELAENPDVLIGSVVSNLMANQIACKARGGALALPLKVGEPAELLAATAAIRGL